jgi:DNA end-binding protein Ku
MMGPRPSEQEVDMVLRLIESQATSFEPRRYRNTHRERLLAFLERRARAQAKVVEPVAPAPAPLDPEAASERAEAFRRIEEGIAALRRGVREPEGMGPAQGTLRFRPLAAREVRKRQGEGAETTRAPQGHDKSEHH